MKKIMTGFIPHTEEDIEQMLAVVGVENLDQLFEEVPAALRVTKELNIPRAASEVEMAAIMKRLSQQCQPLKNFIGAGAYEHFIPAAVWDIVGRGEFYTAYTPYQAEASQGGLQVIYEYQTMISRLTGMDVSNASVYDGATALAESLLMAVRENKKANKKVLVTGALHPHYREVAQTMLSRQSIELVGLDYDKKTGVVDVDSLTSYADQGFAALVIQQPNFFGCLEQVDALTNWAQSNNLLVIACVNPVSLAMLKPPGEWGEKGADIACGEGQPLGVPLASGGPYFGFITCRESLVRQMPGRIVGRTVDTDGKPGFCLTLQAREQHIRRGKAKSNICTNQGLLVTAATIYMSLLGKQGLTRVAENSHRNAVRLMEELKSIKGISLAFSLPFFHEFVIKLPMPAPVFVEAMMKQGILAGYDVSQLYPELENALLVCVTETKTDADLDAYLQAVSAVCQQEELCSC